MEREGGALADDSGSGHSGQVRGTAIHRPAVIGWLSTLSARHPREEAGVAPSDLGRIARVAEGKLRPASPVPQETGKNHRLCLVPIGCS